MDILIEAILDLLVDGGLETITNQKISKKIRIPIFIIVVLIFLLFILAIFLLGLLLIKENILVSFFIIFLAIILLGSMIFKFRKIYLEKFKDNHYIKENDKK